MKINVIMPSIFIFSRKLIAIDTPLNFEREGCNLNLLERH